MKKSYKYFLYSLFLFLFCFNFAFAQTSTSTEIYGGVISQDTIWTKDSSPYVIYEPAEGDLSFTIDAGATLTIEAGTVIKFDYGQGINVLGKLVASGASDEKVYFTSLYDDSVGGDTDLDEGLIESYNSDWAGIQVENGGRIELLNTNIYYAETVLYSDSSTASLDNVNIENCQNGISVYESSVNINNSNIENLSGDAFTLDSASSVSLISSNIKDIDGDGITALFNSVFNIENSNIENISGDAFFAYSSSTLLVKSSTINTVGGGGFGVFYNSALNFENSSIKNIVGQILYMFSKSNTGIKNSSVENSNGGIIFYMDSILNVTDSQIKNVAGGNEWTPFLDFYSGSHLNFSNSLLQNISGVAIETYGTEWGKYATTTLDIFNSTISDGDDTGLQIFGSKMVANITKAKIQNFAGDGIQVFSYPNVLITDSEISNNNNGIVSWGTNLEIKNSIISGNINYGISNNPIESGAFSIKATDNWWGSADGPDYRANPYGEITSSTSNQVSWNVEYEPWLLDVPGAKPKCCSSVLFIPGLEASRLYTEGLLSENQLWEPNRNADVEKLYLDSSGNSINQNIYTRDIIKRTNISLGVLDKNIYKSFSDSLDGLVTEKKINDWEAIPYDWRYDLNKIISDGVVLEDGSKIYFIDEIIKMASSSQTGKVNIITHSNGGLIAKVLINELKKLGKENLIDDLIMVAAPQLGTPSAVSGMLHGDGQEIPAIDGLYYLLNKSTARTLGENMMGAYNLLPQTGYFSKVASPIIKFDESIDGVNDLRTKYGDIIDTYAELRDFILGVDGRSEPANSDTATPNVLKLNLLQIAEDNHNMLDSWIFPTNIKITQLAGWGIKTISGTEYFGRDTCVLGFQHCFPITILDREPIPTEDGDGTVVVPSAIAIDSAGKYYLDLKKLGYKYEHKNIFEASSTIQFIQNLVLDLEDGLPRYITTDKPISTDKTLELSIHSPVSIDVYDSKGNHTGIINNPNPDSDLELVEEGIPGSHYLNFGEGKYVYLDEGEDYIIKFKGLDTGVFTFEAKVISENGSISDEILYKNVSTSKDMTGEMTINSDTLISTTTILKIDSNSDGVMDFNIQPSENKDVTPPIITILGNNPATLKAGGNYVDSGTTVMDDINGDITSMISTSTDLDISKAGKYYFNYTAIDSSGNIATSSRIINVTAVRRGHGVSLLSTSTNSNNFSAGFVTQSTFGFSSSPISTVSTATILSNVNVSMEKGKENNLQKDDIVIIKNIKPKSTENKNRSLLLKKNEATSSIAQVVTKQAGKGESSVFTTINNDNMTTAFVGSEKTFNLFNIMSSYVVFLFHLIKFYIF